MGCIFVPPFQFTLHVGKAPSSAIIRLIVVFPVALAPKTKLNWDNSFNTSAELPKVATSAILIDSIMTLPP
jgi:hypothetical protein